MKIVLARPFDDNDIVEVYVVEHKTKLNDFHLEWDKAKTAVIKKDPETWNINQVIKLMEKHGWQILHVDDVETVLY
jgi:hypothetical protein